MDGRPANQTARSGGRRLKWLDRYLTVFFVIYDVIAIHAAYFLALWFRFDLSYSHIGKRYLRTYAYSITIFALFCVLVFWLCRMYRVVWRYAGVAMLIRTLAVSAFTSICYSTVILLCHKKMPAMYHVFGMLIQFALIAAGRFSIRIYEYLENLRRRNGPRSRVMVIGAGRTGQVILRDMSYNRTRSDKCVCVIDDDPDVWGRFIEGVPIVGGRDEIMSAVEKYAVEKIYLAIPGASAAERRDILQICSETNCALKQLPGMYGDDENVSVSQMKEVSVEDLIGREPIRTDLRQVFEFISGKVVLVTGGGGSIGSELCRQIADHDPKRLIIFDIYENNAYAIQLELKEKHPELDLVTLIGSVRDSRRLDHVFKTYRPDIVYHAAAHKHVPLMEDSPCESIKNNAIGTYKTAYAAMAHGCRRFVLISTDKAVNPTNIMGASKRLCEMIIQSFSRKISEGRAGEIPQMFTHQGAAGGGAPDLGAARTEFVAVRFGNVLGSNGSVVPVFKKQIEKGGPVTVTHPDIIRYFMTIPEAVSLVLAAGTYATGGEIFVLDMGSPVKIADLARNLIRLSGFKPDVDIKIEYTGLRRGEKLYEEKLMAEEGLEKTANNLIHIGKPIPFDVDAFLEQLSDLMEAAYRNDDDIRERVEKIVGTYHHIDAA